MSPGVSTSAIAPSSSVIWATLVALAIGAVMPGRAISQASATCAGVASCRRATASSAASTVSPRASR